MEGSNRRSGVGADNGAHVRNEQLQAFFGPAEEWLKKLREFMLENGPELMGDMLGLWAKWTFYFLRILFENETFKLLIARIFAQICNFASLIPGLSEEQSKKWKESALSGPWAMQTVLSACIFPVESPLQIIASFLSIASEELLQDADIRADLLTGARAVCRVTMLMLVTWMGDLGWERLIVLHCVFICVAQTNLPLGKKALHLVFGLAIHIFLFSLGAEAPTFFCHSLLHVVGSVFAMLFYVHEIRPMIALMVFSFGSVICFYTPPLFGICVATVIVARIVTGPPRIFTDACDHNDIRQCFLCILGGLCVVHLVAWVSGGGFCGALLVFLSPILLLCYYSSDPDVQQARMVRPLPFMCPLIIACLHTPFWVGLVCFTWILVFMLSVANANLIWWSVSFAALHLVSHAFPRNFGPVAMCFLGSYLSYGSKL